MWGTTRSRDGWQTRTVSVHPSRGPIDPAAARTPAPVRRTAGLRTAAVGQGGEALPYPTEGRYV
jgi:hypothetical protein